MEVHSQTVPYVSFMGESLPNHAYMDLTLVGEDDSVQCRTDLSSCCSGSQGQHRGDWYFPNGTRLPLPGQGDIYEAREDQQVDLLRIINNATSPSGIYRCDIPTDVFNDENDISVRETVYVGLYTTGGIYYIVSP